MQNQKIIQQCAEGIVYLIEDYKDPKTNLKVKAILKHRVPKAYRIPEIEKHISLQRIRQETRNLQKALKKNLPVPKIYEIDEKQKKIYMEYFEDYVTLKKYFQIQQNEEIIQSIFNKLGSIIGELHNNQIIHGDLTSSNVMISNDNKTVKLIDFGLSQITDTIEDKAVDLYVFEKSLICEPNGLKFQSMFKSYFMKGYQKTSNKYQQIETRLEKVKMRGRKRIAFGQLIMNNLKNKRKNSQNFQIEQILQQKKKLFQDLQILHQYFSQFKFFQDFEINYGKSKFYEVLRKVQLQRYPPNQIIVQKGQMPQNFYIILTGSVFVLTESAQIKYFDKNKKNGKFRQYLKIKQEDIAVEIKENNIFGEIGLIHNISRTATVITANYCKFAVLSKYDFMIIFKKNLKKKELIKQNFLKSLFIDYKLQNNLNEISKYFFLTNYDKNVQLFNENQKLNFIYFIAKGQVLLKKDLQIQNKKFKQRGFQIYMKKGREEKIQQKLIYIGKNQILGLIEYYQNFDNFQYSAITKTNCIIYRITKSNIQQYLLCTKYFKEFLQSIYQQQKFLIDKKLQFLEIFQYKQKHQQNKKLVSKQSILIKKNNNSDFYKNYKQSSQDFYNNSRNILSHLEVQTCKHVQNIQLEKMMKQRKLLVDYRQKKHWKKLTDFFGNKENIRKSEKKQIKKRSSSQKIFNNFIKIIKQKKTIQSKIENQLINNFNKLNELRTIDLKY